jgi:chaperonin GroEL
VSKDILFDDDAFSKAKEGIDLMGRAVGATLGPRAHNVIYGRPFGVPGVVHDGITVAKEIDPEDPFLKAIAELMKEAGATTNDESGDGTTTAMLLAQSLFTEGRKLVTSGHNAQMLRRGVEKAVHLVVDYLEHVSTPIVTDDPKATNKSQLQVAIISAQNQVIGESVANAFKKLGNDAVITVEESKKNHIYSEYKDGMEINQGYFSRYFLTNAEFDEAVVDNANIIVTDYPFTSASDIEKLVAILGELEINDNLVIIAPDVRDIPLIVLLQNKAQGRHTLAVRAPGYGDEQSEVMEDIAASVGATFISKDKGLKLDDLLPTTEAVDGEIRDIPAKAFVGHAQKVVASKDSTTIVNGMSKPDVIEERVKMIDNRLAKESTSEFEMERLQERKAKLTTGIAIINVGARTEAETKELKERTIDAVGAVKAANDKGIVAGGETALLRASWDLEKHIGEIDEIDEVKAGYRLVVKAMQFPFKTLMSNSGLDAGQMLERLTVATADSESGLNLGVDAIDGEVKNLVEAGIIDPVKVPISALQNAVSTSMGILTSGVIIVDRKKEDASVV